MSANGKLRNVTVLVVDDTKSVRQVLCSMLRDQGVNSVLEAGEGAEAFRIIERSSRPIDLIFCDLQMPGVDGVDTLRGISARNSQSKVVLISALDQKLLRTVGYMAAKMGLQVVGTMAKPFSQEQVGKILERFEVLRARRDFFNSAPISPEELDEALVNGAIEVHYQPKIRMSDRVLLGVEALARLRHPLYGLVGPDCFIPVAEASGAIVPLTQTVLEQAIAQAGRWNSAGLDIGMAINLSSVAIRRHDMPELIAALAEKAGVRNEQITLEITESKAVNGIEMLQIVSRFGLKGFGLAVDDFGTGHSSLDRLKNLPFTELKIDKSFVQGAAADSDLRAIVEASINLGRKLRMSVVAEGPETWEDWEVLKSLECDIAQGFITSKPMPGEQMQQWAQDWAEAPKEPLHLH